MNVYALSVVVMSDLDADAYDLRAVQRLEGSKSWLLRVETRLLPVEIVVTAVDVVGIDAASHTGANPRSVHIVDGSEGWLLRAEKGLLLFESRILDVNGADVVGVDAASQNPGTAQRLKESMLFLAVDTSVVGVDIDGIEASHTFANPGTVHSVEGSEC